MLVLGRQDQVHQDKSLRERRCGADTTTSKVALRCAQYPARWVEAGSEVDRGEARIQHMRERLWHQLIAAVLNRRHEAQPCQTCEFLGCT